MSLDKLCSYFGFTRTPFRRDLAPAMLHRHGGHAEAVARIRWCISETALGVITGEVGAGKTVALRAALAELDASRHTVIYLPNPAVGARGLYAALVSGLGGIPRFHTAALIAQTMDHLAAEKHERGRAVIVAVDEAHLLLADQLEELRLLTNSEMDSVAPFTGLLLGQPTLRRRIKLGAFAALDQRIALRYAMPGMTEPETRDYLTHHLKLAGRADQLFSDDATALIHQTSRGLPRAVNNVALQALCWKSRAARLAARLVALDGGGPAERAPVRGDAQDNPQLPAAIRRAMKEPGVPAAGASATLCSTSQRRTPVWHSTRYGSRLTMLTLTTQWRFRSRGPLAEGPFVSRILIRIAGAACIAAYTSTAVAISTPAAAAQTPGRSTFTSASLSPIVVTNLSSSGAGSLRAAIQGANAGSPGGSAVIDFSVDGTITLDSPLPAISSEVTIDATSAPSYISGGPPVVEIDCNALVGLQFAAGSAGSQLLGVAVDNASGNGVTLNAGSVTLNGNYIGLDLTGAAFGNHGDGVYLSATSSRNLVGLNPAGASGVVANVISGNTGSGIVLSGSSGNTVVSNHIGTNAAGTSAIANGGDGISITGRSSRNQIGGTDFVDTTTGQANNPTGDKGQVPPVFVVPPLGNLISGNARNGVSIDTDSQRNVLNGNFVGTTADGDAAIGNVGDGVWINGANNNSLEGCEFINNPFVYYNVLSGNNRNGLRVTNSNNTVVQGNFLGIGANNTDTVSNRLDGIRVDGSSANTQVGGVIPLGNVSSGNGLNGIEVTGTASGFVTFNTFGGLLAFKGAAPNGNDGLLITSTGGHNLARTNVFSGNAQNGIELAGDASGVTIDPNIVGLTTNGGATLPNGGDGLLIDDTAHDNAIGGSRRSVIPQDTFSGNVGYGLAIVGKAHDNQVFSSYIGTEIGGMKSLGNQEGGILIGGSAYRNSIGDASSNPSNLVSGNTGNGVTLRTGTHNNQVINNYIGLDRIGQYLRNTGPAVVNRGRRNTIRGNSPGVPAGAVTIPGGFTSLTPARLLDTRTGVGAPKAAVAAHGTLHLQVTGRGGVPAAGVSAVVVNVTVTGPASPGYVTVYADGTALPATSSLNFVAGQTVPNLVVAPVGADGKVDLYNNSGGTVQLIADVSGYYLSTDRLPS